MKNLLSILVTSVAYLFSAIWSSAQQVITFDDLSPQEVYAGPIPNGYAGFEWHSFGVMDPELFPGDPVGNLNGMVSPRHVAFPAYVGSLDGPQTGGFHLPGHVFDLNSAYLTSAWNDGLQVEVLGFLRGELIYRSTYMLDTAAPTWVNFNYLGIDEVKFSSYGGIPHGNLGGGGYGMVVDNLSVTIPEPSAISLFLFCMGVLGYRVAKRGWRHKELS